MPKQPPAPKRAPAIPLGGTAPTAFSPVLTKAPALPRSAADAQAHEERITRSLFYAFMVLIGLGLAAAGYAIMTM